MLLFFFQGQVGDAHSQGSVWNQSGIVNLDRYLQLLHYDRSSIAMADTIFATNDVVTEPVKSNQSSAPVANISSENMGE